MCKLLVRLRLLSCGFYREQTLIIVVTTGGFIIRPLTMAAGVLALS